MPEVPALPESQQFGNIRRDTSPIYSRRKVAPAAVAPSYEAAEAESNAKGAAMLAKALNEVGSTFQTIGLDRKKRQNQNDVIRINQSYREEMLPFTIELMNENGFDARGSLKRYEAKQTEISGKYLKGLSVPVRDKVMNLMGADRLNSMARIGTYEQKQMDLETIASTQVQIDGLRVQSIREGLVDGAMMTHRRINDTTKEQLPMSDAQLESWKRSNIDKTHDYLVDVLLANPDNEENIGKATQYLGNLQLMRGIEAGIPSLGSTYVGADISAKIATKVMKAQREVIMQRDVDAMQDMNYSEMKQFVDEVSSKDSKRGHELLLRGYNMLTLQKRANVEYGLELAKRYKDNARGQVTAVSTPSATPFHFPDYEGKMAPTETDATTHDQRKHLEAFNDNLDTYSKESFEVFYDTRMKILDAQDKAIAEGRVENKEDWNKGMAEYVAAEADLKMFAGDFEIPEFQQKLLTWAKTLPDFNLEDYNALWARYNTYKKNLVAFSGTTPTGKPSLAGGRSATNYHANPLMSDKDLMDSHIETVEDDEELWQAYRILTARWHVAYGHTIKSYDDFKTQMFQFIDHLKEHKDDIVLNENNKILEQMQKVDDVFNTEVTPDTEMMTDALRRLEQLASEANPPWKVGDKRGVYATETRIRKMINELIEADETGRFPDDVKKLFRKQRHEREAAEARDAFDMLYLADKKEEKRLDLPSTGSPEYQDLMVKPGIPTAPFDGKELFKITGTGTAQDLAFALQQNGQSKEAEKLVRNMSATQIKALNESLYAASLDTVSAEAQDMNYVANQRFQSPVKSRARRFDEAQWLAEQDYFDEDAWNAGVERNIEQSEQSIVAQNPALKSVLASLWKFIADWTTQPTSEEPDPTYSWSLNKAGKIIHKEVK